ncbi:MAG: hypothetical protein IT376_09185 [Polyangiaceae bacterium]|nr:hypothetical protein [Polyangiaceae bacterium]
MVKSGRDGWRARTAALVALGLGAAACEARDTPPPGASAPATSSGASRGGSAPPPPSGSPRAGPPGASVRPACRVVRVSGQVTSAGAELAPGALAVEPVELPPGATAFLKHTVSGRELELAGPGRFVACPEGEEVVIVASGRVTLLPGAGERPGAEVVLATPAGTVRAAGGRVSVGATVTAGELRTVVEVGVGEAWVGAAAGARAPASDRVAGPAGRAVLSRGRSGAAGALLAACERAAAGSADAAAEVVAPGPGLGGRAARHVEARRAARLACAAARAAVELEAEGARESLLLRVRAAEARARAVPAPGGPARPGASGG